MRSPFHLLLQMALPWNSLTWNTQEVSRICATQSIVIPHFESAHFHNIYSTQPIVREHTTCSYSRHLYAHTTNLNVEIHERGSHVCINVFSPPKFYTITKKITFQTCNLLRGGYILLQQVTLPEQPINMEH